jgi:hypothetical protein
MKKNNPKIKLDEKLYVVRKYIMATSAKQAILKDKTAPVEDVWVDTDWQKRQTQILASAIGFTHYPQEDEE